MMFFTKTYMIQKFAIFRCPTNLHHARSDNQNFIKPNSIIYFKGASDRFKRSCITTGLKYIEIVIPPNPP